MSYAGSILRVDLTTGKVARESRPNGIFSGLYRRCRDCGENLLGRGSTRDAAFRPFQPAYVQHRPPYGDAPR